MCMEDRRYVMKNVSANKFRFVELLKVQNI